MKLSHDDYKYLSGDKFSSGYCLNINDFTECVVKKEYLIEKIRNSKNIHIGCIDHLVIMDEKIKFKKWLHEDIHNYSDYSLGIDINLEGIDYIKNKYPQYNLLYLDVMDDNVPELIKEKEWDYIILPDVIEHINSPVDFLKAIKKNYSEYCDKLIITTPNATRYRSLKEVLHNTEFINSDHRFWFTPYTLSKIIIEANCKIESFDLVESGELPKRNLLKKYLLNKFPLLRDTLIMEVSLV